MKLIDARKPGAYKILLRALARGGVVATPTDTVYGLVGIVTPVVIRKIYRIKKRPAEKALPFFVKNIAAAKKLAAINKRQERFLEHFWPGALTAVLKKRNGFRAIKTSTVALRMPADVFLINLLVKVNRPLTGTSANISGKRALVSEVLNEFKNQKYRPSLVVIETRKRKGARPSTIIDISSQDIKLIRRGVIPFKRITALWKNL